MKRVRTEVLKIESQSIYHEINAQSAAVWNECIYQMSMYQWHRGYPHAHDHFWFGADCEGWIDKRLSKSRSLHSQSIQAVRKLYFQSWRSYSVLKKTGGVAKPKPPNKKKKYMTTRWLKSAITFVDGSLFGKRLQLSMGKGRRKLDIPLPKDFDMEKTHLISTIDLCYKFGQWTLHFTYTDNIEKPESGDGIVGVDIGEIHPMATHDGQNTDIFHGRYIRSLYRHRNKVLSEFSQKISQCKRHSKRWWKLTRRKWKRIRKIDNQIKDALHKHTTDFVKLCEERNIGTIVLGDLTGIRKDLNVGKRGNQKLHQWAFGKITTLIIYKAKELGIKVVQINEAYTSQTCPKCGNRQKPVNRNYICKCGFMYHRDGVGAINILRKYQGLLGQPVAAAMAPPSYIRYSDVPVALA